MAALTGLLAVIEGELMAGEVSQRFTGRNWERFERARVLEPGGTVRDPPQAVNDLRHKADERSYTPRGRLRSVGIWTHYFAATRQELEAMDLDYGPSGGGWPYVDCKGWMLEVEEFAGEIDGRDESEFGRDEPINFDPADWEYEGPWALRINAELAATLARLDGERIRAYADRYLLEDWEVERLLDLANLARSASAEGRQLYVWSSL